MAQRIDLKLWDTPFSNAKFPSVAVISELDGDSTLAIVVAPGGVDAYPKYLVRFSAVYAFMCEEEAGGTSYDGVSVASLTGEPGCAYIWENSSHAEGYSRFIADLPFRGGTGPVMHYLFFLGDNNVGVVTAEPPSIETIDVPRKVAFTYEV